MAQPFSATCTRTSVAPTAPGRPSGLMVMALRAAEQHVLVVLGEADLSTAGQLRAELIDLLPVQPPSVLVELGALEFCDLAGLDALHDAARAAHDAGVALTFRGMSAQLSWLYHTFPPRRPIPPPSTPGKARPVPDTSAATRCTPATVPTAGEPSGQNASIPQIPATLKVPSSTFAARPGCTSAAQRPTTGLTDGSPSAGARRSTDVPSEYLNGRGGGRRGAPDGLVHAVPISDTTRSAVCGARTWLATTSWTGAAPGSCPDCSAAVAMSFTVGTVHPLPAPRTAAAMHLQSPYQPLARQVS